MDKSERLKEVGRYIEKYYIPGNDDIDVDDEEISGFFDKITDFLSGRNKKQKKTQEQETVKTAASIENVVKESAPPDFDITTAKRKKITRPMSEVTISNRKIEDLMSQMEETFSQRLIRMIKERNMTESEAYKKAFVDRRHFAKIKKDEYYAPSKKTVLAFAIALELTLDETKDLLRSAGYALSRSSKFDIIVVYFLEHHHYDMFDINEVLYEYDQPVFE